MKNYIICLLIVSRFEWIAAGLEKALLIAVVSFWLALLLEWFETEAKNSLTKLRKMIK